MISVIFLLCRWTIISFTNIFSTYSVVTYKRLSFYHQVIVILNYLEILLEYKFENEKLLLRTITYYQLMRFKLILYIETYLTNLNQIKRYLYLFYVSAKFPRHYLIDMFQRSNRLLPYQILSKCEPVILPHNDRYIYFNVAYCSVCEEGLPKEGN